MNSRIAMLPSAVTATAVFVLISGLSIGQPPEVPQPAVPIDPVVELLNTRPVTTPAERLLRAEEFAALAESLRAIQREGWGKSSQLSADDYSLSGNDAMAKRQFRRLYENPEVPGDRAYAAMRLNDLKGAASSEEELVLARAAHEGFLNRAGDLGRYSPKVRFVASIKFAGSLSRNGQRAEAIIIRGGALLQIEGVEQIDPELRRGTWIDQARDQQALGQRDAAEESYRVALETTGPVRLDSELDRSFVIGRLANRHGSDSIDFARALVSTWLQAPAEQSATSADMLTISVLILWREKDDPTLRSIAGPLIERIPAALQQMDAMEPGKRARVRSSFESATRQVFFALRSRKLEPETALVQGWLEAIQGAPVEPSR